jgi:hypothetical protein
MLFASFVDQMVVPIITLPGFMMKPCRWICDPSAVNRSAYAPDTAKGILEAKGYDVYLAPTNDIGPRINSLERYLVETRGFGEHRQTYTQEGDKLDLALAAPVASNNISPAILIDPSCSTLISALSGKYRYKRHKTSDQLDVKPEKKHPTSDVVDALTYVSLGLSSKLIKKRVMTSAVRNVSVDQVISDLAWT